MQFDYLVSFNFVYEFMSFVDFYVAFSILAIAAPTA